MLYYGFCSTCYLLYNPFIYYSQTHTIGTDINQNSYPKMKGLCIIDYKTTYTQISQAIFRLRKINNGHSVNIIIINNKTSIYTQDTLIDNTKLLELLKTNEEKNKTNKQIHLKYQSLKSDVRKILNNGIKDIKVIRNNHKENIKYYYLEENNNENILSNIIDRKENIIIHDNESLLKLYDEINTIENLYKLVYNININSENYEIDIEQDDEQNNELLQNRNNEIDKFNIKYLFPVKFEFHNYDIFNNFKNVKTML